VPRTKSEVICPTDALVPVKRGRVVGVDSLYIEASGRAQQVVQYIRTLAGLAEPPSMRVQTMEIEGDNLEELLVSLEKLSGNFKKGPRARKAKEESVYVLDEDFPPEIGRNRRRRPMSDSERAWQGYMNECPYHWPRRCSCNVEEDDSDEEYDYFLLDFLSYLFFH